MPVATSFLRLCALGAILVLWSFGAPAPANWNVEVCDRDVFSEINNCPWLPSLQFTTGR